MLDFQNIRLNSSELESLRRLAEKNDVLLDDFPSQDANRLVSLRFASLLQFDAPSKGNPFFLHIEPAGRDFLMYWAGAEAQRKIETRRFLITTWISVIALLISLASLLADIGLFQLIQASEPTPSATATPAGCTSVPLETPLQAVSPAESVELAPAGLSLQSESNLL